MILTGIDIMNILYEKQNMYERELHKQIDRFRNGLNSHVEISRLKLQTIYDLINEINKIDEIQMDKEFNEMENHK